MLTKVTFLTIALIIPIGLYAEKQSMRDLEERAKKSDNSAIEKLVNILEKDEDPETRAAAARALGNAKIKSASEQLIKSLKVDDDIVRQEIVVSLGKIRAQESVNDIIKIINSNNEKRIMRINGIKSLGYMGSDISVQVLISKLSSSDEKLKSTAIEALGESGSGSAASALLKLMQKEKDNILAATALKKLKAKDSYRAIAELLKTKIGTRDYDSAFLILAELLASDKYIESKEILAKAYLTAGGSKFEFKEAIFKSLQEMKVKCSYCLVNASTLRMRKEPNDRSDITGHLSKNDFATIQEVTKIKYTIDNVKDYWYKIINEKGETGWVFGGYLLKLELN